MSTSDAVKKERDSALKLFEVLDLIEETRMIFGDAMRPLASKLNIAIKSYVDAFLLAHGLMR